MLAVIPGEEALDLVERALLLRGWRHQLRDAIGQPPCGVRRQAREPRRQRLRGVGIVAAEQLVAAIARQHALDVLPRQSRHEVGRKERDVGKGLVEMRDQRIEQAGDVGGDQVLDVREAESCRNLARVRELVVALVTEPHAEARDGDAAPHRGVGHERGDRARVDAARQEDPERHVRHHLPIDGRRQRVTHGTCRVRLRPLANGYVGHVPVARDVHLAVAVHEIVRGRQAADLRKQRPRRDDVLVGEELVQRLQVELARDLGPHQQCLHFGREEEAVWRVGVEQRLLACAIAGGDECMRALVVQRQREHAAQVRERVAAPLLVRVERRLDVRSGSEVVAERFELGAQVRVVVDLPVADDVDVARFVGEGLLAAGDVHERQAPEAESAATTREHAFVLGAAMHERARHAAQGGLAHGRAEITMGDGDDSAHTRSLQAAAYRLPAFSRRSRTTFAGVPTAMANSGISPTTTAPAPTIASRPTREPSVTTTCAPSHT